MNPVPIYRHEGLTARILSADRFDIVEDASGEVLSTHDSDTATPLTLVMETTQAEAGKVMKRCRRLRALADETLDDAQRRAIALRSAATRLESCID